MRPTSSSKSIKSETDIGYRLNISISGSRLFILISYCTVPVFFVLRGIDRLYYDGHFAVDNLTQKQQGVIQVNVWMYRLELRIEVNCICYAPKSIYKYFYFVQECIHRLCVAMSVKTPLFWPLPFEVDYPQVERSLEGPDFPQYMTCRLSYTRDFSRVY